jgi:hypothetical protein
MAELASDSTTETEAAAETLPDELSESESTVADQEPAQTTLPLDQVFSILKNERRRRVLEYLADADEEVSLSDLAEEIAAQENGKDVVQISSSERKRVYVGLYQCHLPKMDSMDVISFNKPRGIVEVGENVDVLYDYLDTDDEPDEGPWHQYSLYLSVAGAGALGAALIAGQMVSGPVVDVAVGLTIVAFLVYAVAGFNAQPTADEDDD